MTHPSGIPAFERFFRSVASIKIHKNDVRRFREFVDEQIDDIAIAGRNSAKWNGRDVVVAQDLPITKGVQERMREFDKLEEAEEIRELLRQVVRQPPGDVTFAEDTERLLPELFGGLSIALARSFRVVDPKVSNRRLSIGIGCSRYFGWCSDNPIRAVVPTGRIMATNFNPLGARVNDANCRPDSGLCSAVR